MKFIYSAILAIQATTAVAWEVTAYATDSDCAATSSSVYRVFYTDDAPVYEGCNGWGPPPAGVSCSHFEQGGAVGPLDCNREFTENPMSIAFSPLTQESGAQSVGSLNTWSQGPADCSSLMNQGDYSGKTVNLCFTRGAQNAYYSWSVSDYGIIQ